MNTTRRTIKKGILTVIIVLSVFIIFPFAVTMAVTGVIEDTGSDDLISGRSIVVKYKNASKAIDINKFTIMVLAERLRMSEEVEVLKAESIMIRTDIYRIMGNDMSIDSTSLGMNYLTEKEMKNRWGKDYETKYNLISDCVASTGATVISYDNKLIEARYSEISSGKILSGAEVFGVDATYLSGVDCPEDLKSPDYLTVSNISYKDFVKKMKAAYSDIGLDDDNPYSKIQVASKTTDGYILKLQVGNVIMTGSKFAQILGLNSACMQIENVDNQIRITTKGKGDGFGVSIYTANIMAQNGSTYDDILKKFYNGISYVNA